MSCAKAMIPMLLVCPSHDFTNVMHYRHDFYKSCPRVVNVNHEFIDLVDRECKSLGNVVPLIHEFRDVLSPPCNSCLACTSSILELKCRRHIKTVSWRTLIIIGGEGSWE
ncbi:hypothetical protein Lal_00041100 [Lupinus albus]|nr:hypothetical protein Lal_00041100 [Lupinus albus]